MPAPLRRAGGGARRGGAGAIGSGGAALETGGSSGAITSSGVAGGGSAIEGGASALEVSAAVAVPASTGVGSSTPELDDRFAAKMSGLPANSSEETCAIVAASPSSALGGSGFADGWPEALFF